MLENDGRHLRHLKTLPSPCVGVIRRRHLSASSASAICQHHLSVPSVSTLCWCLRLCECLPIFDLSAWLERGRWGTGFGRVLMSSDVASTVRKLLRSQRTFNTVRWKLWTSSSSSLPSSLPLSPDPLSLPLLSLPISAPPPYPLPSFLPFLLVFVLFFSIL